MVGICCDRWAAELLVGVEDWNKEVLLSLPLPPHQHLCNKEDLVGEAGRKRGRDAALIFPFWTRGWNKFRESKKEATTATKDLGIDVSTPGESCAVLGGKGAGRVGLTAWLGRCLVCSQKQLSRFPHLAFSAWGIPEGDARLGIRGWGKVLLWEREVGRCSRPRLWPGDRRGGGRNTVVSTAGQAGVSGAMCCNEWIWMPWQRSSTAVLSAAVGPWYTVVKSCWPIAMFRAAKCGQGS